MKMSLRGLSLLPLLLLSVVPSPSLSAPDPSSLNWNLSPYSGVYWRRCVVSRAGLFGLGTKSDCTGEPLSRYEGDQGGAQIAVWCYLASCGTVSVSGNWSSGAASLSDAFDSRTILRGQMGVFNFTTREALADNFNLISIRSSALNGYIYGQ